MEPPTKRRRLANGDDVKDPGDSLPRSLHHPVSPPGRRNDSRPSPSGPSSPPRHHERTVVTSASPRQSSEKEAQVFTSPFQLTWVRDLPEAANQDAVTLRDLLGDPLIAECWEFNFLHDIDFLMAAFDQDVRNSVDVHVVHGFWKKEDQSRLLLQEQAGAHRNVTVHCAYMPEVFGTHHSKMLILLRHDDTAQVIIHTANMIARDWTNMTQAVWQSPFLPLHSSQAAGPTGIATPAMGSGEKFKIDLINYLRAYNQRRNVCRSLVEKLEQHDFSAVKAALIASVPGRHEIRDETQETQWGWAALKHALQNVSVQEGESEIVAQISSIATLGPTDAWLRKTLLDSLKASKNKSNEIGFKVVFPTADEIRRSLDGYESGGSIHTKIQSAQQAKQLSYLRPMFCHWANDAERGQGLLSGRAIQEAGRKRAAPHIKTYIRFGKASIDWALVTSANMSKQAWGEALNSGGEVRIASWEIGVLVWPALFAENAKMVGTFQKDAPPTSEGEESSVVGLRIPYNLPLQMYGENEKPWVATASHPEPDWKGERWVI